MQDAGELTYAHRGLVKFSRLCALVVVDQAICVFKSLVTVQTVVVFVYVVSVQNKASALVNEKWKQILA